MRPTQARYIKNLLKTENEHLQKLNNIVLDSVEQENLILKNLSRPLEEKLSVGQRIADRVARFGGSWKFIIIFTSLMIGWIIVNMNLPAAKRFDPFPFILLNLCLSCLAALQAPVIMMSQNRQEEKDRERNESDYMVNLKAEIEIRTLHQKMDLLIQEQFKQLMETQAEQIRLLQSIIREDGKNSRSSSSNNPKA